MRHLFLLFFCFFILNIANSQIYPPTMKCANTLFNGDVSLEWELPVNTCSNVFNGYRIYISTDTTKPFNLLDIVTNQSQTTYTHLNANGNNTIWYYYMTTDLNCFNDVPLRSEILDNIPPNLTEIDYVTVNEAGNVEVHWFRNTAPETHGYVVLWETPNGFVALDTVWGRSMTSYEHIANGLDGSIQNYTIVATDKCGNTGLVNDLPQHTMFLTGSYDRCERTVKLNWSEYENWPTGIENHQVWLSTNGGPWQFIDNITGAGFAYTYFNANDGDELCFRIYAVKGGTSTRSATNDVCFNIDVVQPMEDIYLRNITYNDSNQIEMHWIWNTNADIADYTISKADSNVSLEPYTTIGTSPPLDYQNTYIDDSAKSAVRRHFYRVHSTDSCNNVKFSNYGASLFLSGVANDDLTNQISWTPFEIQYGMVVDYSIYKIVDGVEEYVETVDLITQKYVDIISGTNPLEFNVCYYIVAQAVMEYPDGTMETISTRSNTVCVQQFSSVVAPNAFTPTGINNEFKTVLLFAESAQFQMVVYDRWGGIVFQTTDPDQGWDGRTNGRAMPQGVYAYLIKITQPNGSVIEKGGSVLLIR